MSPADSFHHALDSSWLQLLPFEEAVPGKKTPSQGLKSKMKPGLLLFCFRVRQADVAAGGLAKEFCEETTCSVCLDSFTDPVTIECGHNFCRACLTPCWGEPERDAASCPLCREPVQQRNLRPNWQLANIVHIAKKFHHHQTIKGTEGAGGVCGRHQEPLKLFCRDDEAPICVVCDKSKDHKEHRVIPVEETAEEYKEKIQAQLQSVEKEREKLVEWKVIEEQRSQKCLKQLEVEKQKIMSVFEQIRKFLEEQERSWLTQLADLEKVIKERQEENMTRLSEEISHVRKLIKDVEVKCQQPPSEFLQDIKCSMSRCQVRQRQELSPGLEQRLESYALKTSVLKEAMEEFEGSLKQALSKVSVTLDPKTAHPCLILSEDLKTVKWGKREQNLPVNTERFDCEFCVLGCERFTSGRHCWEIAVETLEERGWWAVGVARESLRRKERFVLRPNEGVWAVGKDVSLPRLLWAFTSPQWTPLNFLHQPRKIRVFLDYEEGRVEFFNADTSDLIFTFPSASFSEEGIRPFFLVGSGVCLKW